MIPFRSSTDRPATPVVKQFMKSLTEPSPPGASVRLMFKIRSIAVRLILAISLTVAVACGILGTFSIAQQRSLTQLALDQQLKLQYDSVTAAIDYEGRAALAVSVRDRSPAAGRRRHRKDRPRWIGQTARRSPGVAEGAGHPVDLVLAGACDFLLPRPRAEGVRRRCFQAAFHRGGSDQDRQVHRRRRARSRSSSRSSA